MDKIKIPDNLKEVIAFRKQSNKANVSPLHEFILKARQELEETSTKGDGSFGFYLGLLKKIPISELYSILSTSKSAKSPIKAFWWHIGQYRKSHKLTKAPYQIGDIVRITKGPTNKVGKIGKVMTLASNGVIMEIGPNMFTTVQFIHLERYEKEN